MGFVKYISTIANQYSIHNYEIQKLRSVYKIKSKDKSLIVKKFNSKKKLFNTKKIIDYLKTNNFKYVQNIVYNLNNEFFIEIDNNFYVCFEWIDGREANIRSWSEIRKCIKTIYLYHESIKNIDYSSMDLKDDYNWIKNFDKDILNLYKIKKLISDKRQFNIIDKFYYDNIDKAIFNISKIKEAIELEKYINFLESNKIICHNSLYYQNFILSNGAIYLIDFGGIVLNYRIYDIARFGRRILYKNKFNMKILNKIYKFYNSYYKFCKIEEILFYFYVKYPYKFVKFANKIYLEGKDIDEIRLLRKLKMYYEYEFNVF